MGCMYNITNAVDAYTSADIMHACALQSLLQQYLTYDFKIICIKL